MALERDVRLVRYEEGSIEISLLPGAAPQLAQTLMRKLQEWTGGRWLVAISREKGRATLKEEADAKAQEALVGVQAEPLVQSVFAHFPGAEIVAVRAPEAAPAAATPLAPLPAETSDEIAYTDSTYTEDDL
jgi:DNA polymerase-3 subunit gamma/tau